MTDNTNDAQAARYERCSHSICIDCGADIDAIRQAVRREALSEVAAFCEERAGPGPADDQPIRGGMFPAGWWRALTTTAGLIRADQIVLQPPPSRAGDVGGPSERVD